VTVSRALVRLLRVRDLEEEQCRLALESAIGQLNRLEQALVASEERDRRGRRLIEASARNGEFPDRLAGIEEMHAASRRAEVLIPRMAEAKTVVAELRQAYIEKRTERRQAETLIEAAKARDAIEAERRSQQNLDDWYRNRMHRVEAKEETGKY
jgi:hypothetical protein